MLLHTGNNDLKKGSFTGRNALFYIAAVSQQLTGPILNTLVFINHVAIQRYNGDDISINLRMLSGVASNKLFSPEIPYLEDSIFISVFP